jgi:hypothetical protein
MLITSFGMADDFNPNCDGDDFAFIFNNGMFNDPADAKASRDKLESSVKQKFVRSEIAYNTNEPILEQLLQIYEQYIGAGDRFYWSYLTDLNGPKWFTDAIIAKIQSIDWDQWAKDGDLQKQVALPGSPTFQRMGKSPLRLFRAASANHQSESFSFFTGPVRFISWIGGVAVVMGLRDSMGAHYLQDG